MTGTAGAATLNVVGGQLLGATGVIVDGSSYSVEFLDGTCVALFNGCDDITDFTFQSSAAAVLASQALLDQVFLDGAEAFDSTPELTVGCGETEGLGCLVLTPYGVGDAAAAWNNDGVFLEDTTLGGLTFEPAFDFTGVPDAAWAVWTASAPPTPVPSMNPLAAGLLTAGLIALGVRNRREV